MLTYKLPGLKETLIFERIIPLPVESVFLSNGSGIIRWQITSIS